MDGNETAVNWFGRHFKGHEESIFLQSENHIITGGVTQAWGRSRVEFSVTASQRLGKLLTESIHGYLLCMDI